MSIEKMLKQIEEAQKSQTEDDRCFWNLYHEVCSELQKIRESANRLHDYMIDIIKIRNLEKKSDKK
jgi:hypothetical protein